VQQAGAKQAKGPGSHCIPSGLTSRADAEEFMRDHQGKRIYRFDEVKRDLPGMLEIGCFD
jgi:nitrous oxide reductase accessory protein NosL